MEFSSEQKLALYSKDQNILVSAGAGSGKTRVLTERILNHLKNGIDINNLLVLTFTKNAANEMKDRVRIGLLKEENLKDQVIKLESSMITTFDAFSLYFVKKYYYVLGIDKNVNLGDSLFFKVKLRSYLKELFEQFYQENNPVLYKILKGNRKDDDNELFEGIIKIYEMINLKPDFEEYLIFLENNHYLPLTSEKIYEDYLNLIKKHQSIVKELYEKYYDDFAFLYPFELDKFIDFDDYNSIANYLFNHTKYIRTPNKFVYKDIYSKIKENLDIIRKYCVYENEEELKKEISYSASFGSFIVNILRILNRKMNDYKKTVNLFEFIDIAKMAIKILKENPSILAKEKKHYYEILVDEYQDTSDLQETFINLLSNNNVYMVGDIKQSIYRFRNANPNIFKRKYTEYGLNNGGLKIDMTNNFRSRDGVINTINDLFDFLMDPTYGDANYIKEHHMNPLNGEYKTIGKNNENCFEVYHYHFDKKENEIGINEYEAFIVSEDIKQKMSEGYLVFDPNIKKMRPCTYKDFAIITSTSSSYEEFKKVFDYQMIPLQIFQNESVTKSPFIHLIINILVLYKSLSLKQFDEAFRHALMSLSRSILIDISDEELFVMMKENQYFTNPLVIKMQKIINLYSSEANTVIFSHIIEEFDIFNKLVKDKNILEANIVIEYVINTLNSLVNCQISFIEFCDYFSSLIKDFSPDYQGVLEDSDSVLMMNIHKSKGLEYKIIYFPDLKKSFNKEEFKGLYTFSDRYGFIISHNCDSPLRVVNNYYRQIEDISERIRLFYVALTRVKEKAILISQVDFEKTIDDKEDFSSFDDFLLYIKNYLMSNKLIHEIYVDVDLDYLNTQENEIVSLSKEATYKEIKVQSKDLSNKHASVEIEDLISKDKYYLLKRGTKFHEILENLDLKNPSLDGLDEFYQKHIKSFLNKINLNGAKIYQEHEFIYESNNEEIHGIIDLLLEYDDYFAIIDYKLSNADVKKYKDQLMTYKKYLNSISNKKVKAYLYSLMKDEMVEVEL